MQEAERSIRPEGAPTDKGPVSSPSRRGVAPLVAFGVLLAVIAAVVLLVQLTGEDTATPGTPDSAPADTGPATRTLTDEEAVAELTRLSALLDQAGRDRNLELLSIVYTSDSPVRAHAEKFIRTLRNRNLLERNRVEVKSVDVLTSAPTEITLQETRWLYPCYVTESGKDVTRSPAIVEQVRAWTLRLEGTDWKIFDGEVKSEKSIDDAKARCP